MTDRSVIQYLGYREQQGVTKEFEEALKQQEGIENLSEIYEQEELMSFLMQNGKKWNRL